MRPIPTRRVRPTATLAVVFCLSALLAACTDDDPAPPTRVPAVADDASGGALPGPAEVEPPGSPGEGSPFPRQPLAVAPAPLPDEADPPAANDPPADDGSGGQASTQSGEEPEGGEPVVHAYAAIPRRVIVDIYRRPGAIEPRYAFDVENPWGQRAPLLVEKGRHDDQGRAWVRVQLPIAPNGTTGWVRVESVRLVARDELIVVDLSERTLRHYVGGRQVSSFSVGVGRPGAPSARGLFSVWARVPQADGGGPYGTFVLGLSGLAPISEWVGEGRMAIHGTASSGDRGRRVSAGCIRVFNPQMERLTGIPLGTPVVIRC
ncbi:MAG: L,D-transpeptidase family protein [Actinomycetota bacterium]